MTPRLLVFASGTKDGGGSGFENLVASTKDGRLDAEIVGIVCNHERGGVRERADRLGIPFIHFAGPYDAEHYQQIVTEARADFVALSGWLKLAVGLDPRTTFNIHPAPLPEFGGKNFYGIKTHEAVLEAYKAGRITHSAVSMHFVTPEFDEGPVFFSHPVEILPEDTPETLAHRVNEIEHRYQPEITNKVVHGEISWDGVHPDSLCSARVAR
jgi:phosphoribosylglycinamide formyltransferase-1